MVCSEKLRWTLGAWLSFLSASSGGSMLWQKAIWKQMGFNGTTFEQSIPSFGFRTTSCNHVLCIIIYVLCTISVVVFCWRHPCLWAHGWSSSFWAFWLQHFLQNLHDMPPASPLTRGPRTRCKSTRRCALLMPLSDMVKGWTGWISAARWTRASTRWTSRRSVRDLSRTPWS